MLSWFDKISNPAWHKIKRLNDQEAFELSLVVAFFGGIRKVIREELVDPFEKLGDPSCPKEILKGSFGPIVREVQNLSPISGPTLERLVDECELGMLTCQLGRAITENTVFNGEVTIEVVGILALAEINHRLGRKEPTLLTETGYSADPDECRVQVLLAWMRLTGLQNPQFPALMSELFFAGWNDLCRHLLDGFMEGINRVPRQMFFARVRQDCSRLSAPSVTIISELADRIAQKSSRRGAQVKQEDDGILANIKRIVGDAPELIKHADASTFVYKESCHWIDLMFDDYERYRLECGSDPLPIDLMIAAVRRYVGSVGGRRLTNSQYKIFVRGFQIYLLENTFPDEGLATVYSDLKKHFMLLCQTLGKLGMSEDIRNWQDHVLKAGSSATVIEPKDI